LTSEEQKAETFIELAKEFGITLSKRNQNAEDGDEKRI